MSYDITPSTVLLIGAYPIGVYFYLDGRFWFVTDRHNEPNPRCIHVENHNFYRIRNRDTCWDLSPKYDMNL